MPMKNNAHQYYWFILLLVFAIMAGILVYINWLELITLGQNWQRYFHQKLVQFLMQTKTTPLQTGLLLICFSFLYGIIHSAGPGHGKIIISTYLATQPSQLKKSLLLTLFSAIIQGLVAIILITTMLMILNLSSKYLKIGEYGLELASYILIMLVGLFLCYRSIKKLIYIAKKTASNTLKITQIHPMNNSNTIAHSHSQNCTCCGHKHIPDQKEMNHTKGWMGDLGIILAIGMRPCSGALLILIFSYTIDAYYWGIIATFAMSIGTALTTSLFALLVHYAKKFAEYLVTQKRINSSYLFPTVTQSIAFIGGLLFMIMGLILTVGISYPSYSFGNPLLG